MFPLFDCGIATPKGLNITVLLVIIYVFHFNFEELRAQESGFLRISPDFYDEHAPRLFERGQLAPYTSAMPDRPAPQPDDSLPALPWAYEIDAGQLRHHLRRQGGWVWLVVSTNHCKARTCPREPPNLNGWLPFFDSLKATGSFSVRYVTNSYEEKQVRAWRQSLDQRGVREPMLIISNEAHGTITWVKLRHFVRQLAGASSRDFPRYAQCHLLFDPEGHCVLVAAERELEPGPTGRDRQPKALTPEQIRRRALAVLRGG